MTIITNIVAAQAVNMCQDFYDQRVLIEMDIDEAQGRFNYLFNHADYFTGEVETGVGKMFCFVSFSHDGTLTAIVQTQRWNLRFDLTNEGMLYLGTDLWEDSFDLENDWIELVAPLKWFLGLPTEHDRLQ